MQQLPSRFQLKDEVSTPHTYGVVVGVAFKLVDYNDGLGEAPKIFYTVQTKSGQRLEFASNDVHPMPRKKPALKVVENE